MSSKNAKKRNGRGSAVPKKFKLSLLCLIPSVDIGNETGDEVLDDLSRGIDTKVIGAALAPFFVGKHGAVSAATLIRLAHFAKKLFIGQMLVSARFSATTRKLCLLGGGDKDMKGTHILQNDVCASADDHTVARRGKLAKERMLCVCDLHRLEHGKVR